MPSQCTRHAARSTETPLALALLSTAPLTLARVRPASPASDPPRIIHEMETAKPGAFADFVWEVGRQRRRHGKAAASLHAA